MDARDEHQDPEAIPLAAVMAVFGVAAVLAGLAVVALPDDAAAAVVLAITVLASAVSSLVIAARLDR